MPSTYTTNLGIEKIATGEQSGTWGDTTNTNWDLADESINGIVSTTLPAVGTTGSPNDIDITEGVSSVGRHKYIEFVDGGDLGGTAYVRLTPNDAEKIVHIRNSLTASRDIIVFQGTYNASNDFTVPNGADVVLKFNGGGAGAVVSDVFVNLHTTAITAATYNGLPVQSIDTLSDTTITGPTTDDILQWSGSAWVDVSLAEAGISAAGSYDRASSVLSGASVFSDFTITNGLVEATATRAITLADLGYTGDGDANNYVHPTNVTTNINTSGADIVDIITTSSEGHITAMSTRTLTLANLGYTGATDANNYTHPTHPGDDFSVDSGALTGATVISDIDINVTTDTLGHVTDANGTIATRNLTAANVGALASGGTAVNSQLLDSIDSTSFLRSDATDIKTSGHLTFNDNIYSYWGTGNDNRMFFNGTHLYLDVGVVTTGANFYIRDGSTTRFTFDDAGHFTATGNVTAYSDERLKDNVTPLENAREKLFTLTGYEYDRNDMDGEHHIGLIAQEVEKVYPECVIVDDQAECSPEDRIKSLNYGALVAPLIEAMKEQQKEINELRDILEDTISSLRTM